MIKEAISKVRSNFNFLIEEYGILDEHKSEFLLSLEALESLVLKKHTRSRKRFPKTFSINQKGSYDVMEERIDGVDDPIFCSRGMYEIVVQAAVNMQLEGKDFNRYTLEEYGKKFSGRITIPAIMVCLHYWISLKDALLQKRDGSDLFALSCGPECFKESADKAWDMLKECELRIEAPRNFL